MKLIIEVIKIPHNEGGGYNACVPELGRCAVMGDGDSPMLALRDLCIGCGDTIQRHLNTKEKE